MGSKFTEGFNVLTPQIPENEIERLQSLCALNILDTPPEPGFDRMTLIAKTLFDVPIALVSLVDANRQWFKSRQGLGATETPRDVSFCGHAILNEGVFVIPDSHIDPRFADNPLVTGAPFVRFYAGAPLTLADGARIGTLCIIDHKPREFSKEQCVLLTEIAHVVVDELNRRTQTDVLGLYQAEQQRLQAVLDTVVDGIIAIDSKGSILLANPATERLFGFSMAEMLGQNVKMLMPQPFEREHDQYLQNYRTTRKPKIIGIGREVLGQRKDGSTFPMYLAVSEMVRGKHSHFVGVVRDISEQKRMERMKREFVSTVSHELRTPLTSIRGALALVMKKSGHLLPEKSLQMLETASRNSERLTLLVNDILDMEKIEGGQLEFEFSAVDLPRLLAQSVTANEAYAQRHKVTFHLDANLPAVTAWIDESRIFQVMANLLSNAAKFSPPGGRVEISLLLPKEGFARVQVRDHGRGIPESFRRNMFGRFNQVDASDARERGGTGLGLSITKAIIEHHGGDVGYDSVLGEGSTFYFDVPLAPTQTVSAAASTSHTVLICEDNPDVCEILKQLLENEGIGCDVAASAQQARACLAAKRYELMLLDLSLPDTDGLTLLQELRANPVQVGLRFIVISGRAMEGKKNWSGDAMAVMDWIQKPFDEDRLIHAVNCALSNGQRPRILHVEDDADVLLVTRNVLEESCDYDSASTAQEARKKLGQNRYDLVLLDLGLPDLPGAELLLEIPLETQVVIFSGSEPAHQVKERIAATLSKSMTSNESLLNTIKSVLRRTTQPIQE